MAGVGLDEVAEAVFGAALSVRRSDLCDSTANLFDGRALVLLTKVQMQRPRCDQGGDVWRIAMLVNSRHKIREAVQAMNY